MRLIIDYSLIESDNNQELVEAIKLAGHDDWQPLGGVCVWFEPVRVTAASNEGAYLELGGGTVHYVQAMVKYATPV